MSIRSFFLFFYFLDGEWYNYDNPNDRENFCPALQVKSYDKYICI